jgi:hypothetical protein
MKGWTIIYIFCFLFGLFGVGPVFVKHLKGEEMLAPELTTKATIVSCKVISINGDDVKLKCEGM